MSKVLEDAKANAEAAAALVAEIEQVEQEPGETVDKTVSKVTVFYSDGSSVDFVDAGSVAGGIETPETKNPTLPAADSANGSTDADTAPKPESTGNAGADAKVETTG